MLDGTYAGLKASVADFLNRADLTAVIPDFIALAEAQMNRRLRVRRMIGTATATISSEYGAVPTDFAGELAITLSDGRQLDYMTPDGLAQKKWQTNSPIDEPFYYSVVGDQFQFLPAPNAGFTTLVTYYRRLPALATNNTNWLLTDNPDAYLYGSLTQAAPYLIDDARVQVWGSLFTTAISDIIAASLRESGGSRLTPLPSTVV